jgi:chromosome segregation ATPase
MRMQEIAEVASKAEQAEQKLVEMETRAEQAEQKLAMIQGIFSGNLPATPSHTEQQSDAEEAQKLSEKIKVLENQLDNVAEEYGFDKEKISNEHAMEKTQMTREIERLKASLSTTRSRMKNVTKNISLEHELLSSINQTDAATNAENKELKSEVESLKNKNLRLNKRLSR